MIFLPLISPSGFDAFQRILNDALPDTHEEWGDLHVREAADILGEGNEHSDGSLTLPTQDITPALAVSGNGETASTFRADESQRHTYVHEVAKRCAWCGMVARGPDRASVRQTQLCGACSAILRGVDWKRLIGQGEPR